MKKLIGLFLVAILVLLSGCSASDDVIDEPTAVIHENLYYSLGSMSYTNTPDYDILYQVDDTYEDFVILHEKIMNTDLTQGEKTAYEQVLDIIDQVEKLSPFSYSQIIDFSSKEFNDLCESKSIILSLVDVVTFNALKELFSEMRIVLNTKSSSIAKLSYIEIRLDVTLSTEEIESLDLLQNRYSELFSYDSNYSFDFKTKSLEDLLLDFESNIEYIPSDNELLELEIAYDILQLLINE